MNQSDTRGDSRFFRNFRMVSCVELIGGLFFMALGVSLSVKADLGVSPISCVPYIYSFVLPFSLGELTIFMNGIFILLQIAVLRKNYQVIQLVQFIAVILLGYFIDFTLFLISGMNPTNYFEQLVILIGSCAFIAFGVFLLVKADMTYIPGDGLLVVISKTYRKEFGKVKICFDSSMVIIGIVSSLLFLHRLVGVREGTVLAAFLVGLLIQFYEKTVRVLSRLPDKEKADKTVSVPEHHIITISREYGSGGHEIGQYIAKKLNISFYDRELINITAEKSGFTKEYIQENEQKIENTLFHELYAQNYAYVNDTLPPSDTLFLIQSKIVHDISRKESCVVVGRCANYILKDNPRCFNVFIHADNEFRKSRIINKYKRKTAITDQELEQADRERANYCRKYTGQDWKDSTNYHVTIDSSRYTIKQIAENIISLVQSTSPVQTG